LLRLNELGYQREHQEPAQGIFSAASHGEQPLDPVLRPTHDGWIKQARRFLEPALEPGADFWARWAAVRYLSDAFRELYRLERARVQELRPRLQPEMAERLLRESDRVLRLRLELDRIVRRRGTSAEVATGRRDLLAQLGVWCAEIEVAARGITRGALPAGGADLLVHLEAILQNRR
jgi:hypothetical protein